MSFKFDLHSHTRYSDGTGTPEQIAKAASEAKLDVLCLTDHNSNDGPAAYPGAVCPDPREIHDVARALIVRGVQPIIGCEYSTAQGHLLVYGVVVPAKTWGMYPQMQDVIDEVNRLGGACIVPHAFHGYQRAIKSDLIKITGLAAVEGWNGRVEAKNPGTNALARAAAERMGCPVVASTDSHAPRELGRCYNLFPEMVRNGAELVAALRAGQFTPFCDTEAFAAERPRYKPHDRQELTGMPKTKHPAKTQQLLLGPALRRPRPESTLDADAHNDDAWIPDSWRRK